MDTRQIAQFRAADCGEQGFGATSQSAAERAGDRCEYRRDPEQAACMQSEAQQATGDILIEELPETLSDDFDILIEEAVRATTPKRRPRKLVKKPAHPKPPPLTIEQILAWADAYHASTGVWPKKTSGRIIGAETESWSAVQAALRTGSRGMPGGSTLARLLEEHRGVRNLGTIPDLTISTILQWADDHHDRIGRWPNGDSGEILAAPGETWGGVNASLLYGHRSLPGRSTLARLLAEHRGVRNMKGLPPLNEDEILRWADAYRERKGIWPTRDSGPIEEAQWDTWKTVDIALYRGLRGLPGGRALARLIAEQRGASYRHDLEPFTVPQILAWADAWHHRHGKWPYLTSGPVYDGADITWTAVHAALRAGHRGLPGGSSLARLLALHLGVANRKALLPFTRERILEWADCHKERTAQWPTGKSGAIVDAPGETWCSVAAALRVGSRGLPGGSSLAALLAEERGRRDNMRAPKLTEFQILLWADTYRERTGKWPKADSGPIPGEPGERWSAVDAALAAGTRGLPGGSSLARLLCAQRGVRNHLALPELTEAQILSWAAAYRNQTGAWPTEKSGLIEGALGETWGAVSQALRNGSRGLPGGSSLARLLRTSHEMVSNASPLDQDRFA